jgi:hypothetical protein
MVELLVVVQAVGGSSPLAHPSRNACKSAVFRFSGREADGVGVQLGSKLFLGRAQQRLRCAGSGCSSGDLATVDSMPPVLLGQDGVGPAYDVVAGAMRPVLGIVATLEARELPETGSTWQLQMPENLKPGPERGRLWQERHLLHWPKELLGIDWPGDAEIAAPARLVIGRPVSYRPAWRHYCHPCRRLRCDRCPTARAPCTTVSG